MISDATYAEAGVPLHQLGLKWTSWTRNNVRTILDHYSVDYVPRASKLELLRELDVLVQQRNLSIDDRRVILAGSRPTPTRVATAAQESSAPQAFANFLPHRGNHIYLGGRNGSAKSVDDSSPEEEMDAAPEPGSFANDREANDCASDIQRGAAMLQKCGVCIESLRLEAFPNRKITPACSHEPDVCLDCLAQHITSQSCNKVWNHIDCPSCSARLGYQDVRAFATAKMFERYDDLTNREAVSQMPGFRACRAPGCTSGQIHWGGEAQPIMTCCDCEHKTCIIHEVEWHAGMTCTEWDENARLAQMRQAELAANEEYLTASTKPCPNLACARPTEKNGGCQHMTCTQCRHQYCWDCHAPWASIIHHGNIMHAETCPQHSNNVRVHPADARWR